MYHIVVVIVISVFRYRSFFTLTSIKRKIFFTVGRFHEQGDAKWIVIRGAVKWS
jgi:hypothetical protein